MDNVLDFRRICKKYFLYRAPNDASDSDEEMSQFHGGSGNTRGSRMRKYEREGMGLLKVASADFMATLKQCAKEL